MRHTIRLIVLGIFVFGCATLSIAQMAVHSGEARTAGAQKDAFPTVDLAKEDLVESVLREAQRELSSTKTMDAAFQSRLKVNLLAKSTAELNKLVAEGHALTPVLDTLGSQTGDLVYTPLPTPCRFYDTRAASGYQGAGTGPLAAGTPTSLVVASYCGSPYPLAKAVMVNIVAVTPSGVGNLRAWPWDSTLPPAPNSSVINYVSGQNLANGVVIPVCNIATATGGNCGGPDLFLEAFNHSTDVVIDMLGYFAAPAATPVDTVVQTVSWDIAPQNYLLTTSPSCPAGYAVTGGGAKSTFGVQIGPSGFWLISSGQSGDVSNAWQCIGWNNQPTGGAHWTGVCQVYCTRIPGN